ncbi:MULTISPECIES: chemotaxis protein CheW [unclassified Achromobacter]|uniref:chemotaxis protein CheW n=1 Tax=unclassified Achromobacter TaxID=2626865 RepID=UPI000B519660|nr:MULTISPECIES: chemotaxis protein CheW [unclassified Achromobacter]OWT70403.1 chemotaxis protein CheW [Achromobacter sp. HZ34]OWT71942.1 chemotaxis protein CheW [Achromobacter sp. HZ28]
MVEHAAAPIDDCWNRIGIRGDMSCPRLREHIHCRNCPVYATAARRLLDRHPATYDDADDSVSIAQVRSSTNDGSLGAAQARHGIGGEQANALAKAPGVPGHTSPHAGNAVTVSALVFRLGAEWLALPTSTLTEVATMRAIHTLPRRSGVVTGVCNIRGRLLACISLPVLLGLSTQAPAVAAPVPSATSAASARAPRLLILNSTPRAVVVPVDEVEGIHAYDADALSPVPATLGAERYTRAIARHGERTIGVLDGERLLRAIDRSLA